MHILRCPSAVVFVEACLLSRRSRFSDTSTRLSQSERDVLCYLFQSHGQSQHQSKHCSDGDPAARSPEDQSYKVPLAWRGSWHLRVWTSQWFPKVLQSRGSSTYREVFDPASVLQSTLKGLS